jgi:predicted DNA-binding protein with PD1-like motif
MLGLQMEKISLQGAVSELAMPRKIHLHIKAFARTPFEDHTQVGR